MDGQPGAVAEGERVGAGCAGVVESAHGLERAGVEDEVSGVVGPLLFSYGCQDAVLVGKARAVADGAQPFRQDVLRVGADIGAAGLVEAQSFTADVKLEDAGAKVQAGEGSSSSPTGSA